MIRQCYRKKLRGKEDISTEMKNGVFNKKWDKVLFFLILFIAGFFYTQTLGPGVGYKSDDAHYIVLAKSIATGQGFRIISDPQNPPEGLCSFGFPLILALPYKTFPIFPENIGILKFTSIIFTLLFLFVVYSLMQLNNSSRREYLLPLDNTKKWALILVLLTAFNHRILGYSTMIMSEMSYAFFSVLALLLAEKYQKSHAGNRHACSLPLLLLLALLWSYFIRPAGIFLLIAILIYLLVKREYAKAGIIGMCFIIAIIPWLFYKSNISGYDQMAFFFKSSESSAGNNRVNLVDLFIRFFKNLHFYGTYGIPSIIFPTLCSRRLINFFALRNIRLVLTGITLLVITLPALYGLYIGVIRKRKVLFYYAATHLFLHCWWPWQENRFLVPIIPFLFYSYLLGITSLFSLVLSRLKSIPHITSAVADQDRGYVRDEFIILTVAIILLTGSVIRYTGFLDPKAEHRERKQFTENFDKSFLWIKKNTPEESILMCINGCQFYLYTDRKTVGPPSVNPLEVLKSIESDGVDYLIIAPYGTLSELYLQPVIDAYPDLFTMVFQSQNKKISIYKFLGPAKPVPTHSVSGRRDLRYAPRGKNEDF